MKKKKYKHNPGDILRIKRDWCDHKKGDYTLIIGYDYPNYVSINLNNDLLVSWSINCGIYDSKRLYDKINSVDLKKLPINIEDQIDQAKEEPYDRAIDKSLLRLLKSEILKPYLKK